jgi:hypothetical protein
MYHNNKQLNYYVMSCLHESKLAAVSSYLHLGLVVCLKLLVAQV